MHDDVMGSTRSFTYSYITWIMRIIIYCFVLTSCSIAAVAAYETYDSIIPVLNRTELELYSDSTSSQNWSSYSLALLIRGWPEKARYALERADRCDNPSPIMYRALATCSWLKGNTQESIEYLTQYPSDIYTDIALVAYLQENNDLTEADRLISDIHSQNSLQRGLVSLLNSRQLRLTGNMQQAFTLLDTALRSVRTPDILRSMYKLEMLLYHDRDMPDLDYIDCVKTDIALTGGVYIDPLLSHINEFSSDFETLLLKSRILSILCRHREAEEIIPSSRGSVIYPELALWHIELLIHLDRMNEAMDEVLALLEQDSTNSRALQQQGILLMRGGRYNEAFLEMQKAWNRTGSPGCVALQGLAAEFAGHTKLAFETYTTLVSLNADSIILINRNRDLVLNIDLQKLLDSEGNESFTDHRYSGLSGNASLSYYNNTGEYENRNFSVKANIIYKYGLYGSNITASGKYTLNRWPESESEYTSIMTSLSVNNYSTRRFFQQLLMTWEKRDYSTDRNRFEATAGLGYRFDPFSKLQCTGYMGFGRSEERLDSEIDDHWIVVPELKLRLRGSSFLSVIPFIELSGEAAYNLDSSEGYELTLSALIDLLSNGLYSFSLGYDASQSYQPQTDYYFINRCTYIMLTLRFE